MSLERRDWNLQSIEPLVERLEATKVEKGGAHVLEMHKSIDEVETTFTQFDHVGDPDKKIFIRLMIRKCQLLGIDENWNDVVVVADKILTTINSFEMEVDFDYRSNIEATVLGYKGFSLMKLSRIDEAIVSLTKSYELRSYLSKAVTLISGKGDFNHDKPSSSRRKEFIQVEKALTFCCKKRGIAAPIPPLTKFNRTVHLFDTGGTAVSNDDLVLSQDDSFYHQIINDNATLYVEEKVDGANFGLSLSADGRIFAQNRSHYISTGEHAQFGPLSAWLEENRAALTDILRQHNSTAAESRSSTASQGLILYGEWVVARHSIPYNRLPSYFVAFDIYDRRRERFWSRRRFHNVMKGSGIPVVPMIKVYKPKAKTAELFRRDLLALLETKSEFRTDGGLVEGIVLRVDDNDIGNMENQALWLSHRLKIVRPDFVGGCSEHWSRRDIEKQTVDYAFAQDYMRHCYKCAD